MVTDANTSFIRQRPWCACGRSCNAATGRLEAGLSVYECRTRAPGRWVPIGNAWKKEGESALKGISPWFLVRGENFVGRGGDGEPLFEQLTLVKHLRWNDGDGCFEGVDEIHSVAGNHEGYPDCKCQGGLELYKQLQDDMYGNHLDEDDDA